MARSAGILTSRALVLLLPRLATPVALLTKPSLRAILRVCASDVTTDNLANEIFLRQRKCRVAIRGIIFDYNGVIRNMRWDVAHRLEEEYGLESGILYRALFRSDEWRQLQIGYGDENAWLESGQRRLEEAAGRPLPPLHQRWLETWDPIQENVGLIRDLKPSYRLAVLGGGGRTEQDLHNMGIHHLFDIIVDPAAIHVAKPDPRAYRLTADRLGLAVEECLFIDDTELNVNGAREVGMAALHYRFDRGDDLEARLAELGVRPARG